jgi:hypothetical protein
MGAAAALRESKGRGLLAAEEEEEEAAIMGAASKGEGEEEVEEVEEVVVVVGEVLLGTLDGVCSGRLEVWGR